MEHRLKNPDFLEIQTPRGRVTGGSQTWYADKWRRTSGCGPTAAANIIWYLSRSRPGLGHLRDISDDSRASFQKLQNEMFGYITPGMGGVNNSRIFTGGMAEYAGAHGVKLTARALDIPQFKRPTARETRDFILEGLSADCPVAFLNLSNGNQHRLDSWHWVTLVALDSKMDAGISDQGWLLEINIKEWRDSTLLGGAFVFMH